MHVDTYNNSSNKSILSLHASPVVLMSPEVATTHPWRSVFEIEHVKRNLALVAIDEAHCICEWLVHNFIRYSIVRFKYSCEYIYFCRGPNFRTAFKKLGGLRAIAEAPFMALSASAPPAFEKEIVSSLALVNPVVIKQQQNRPNICISVGKKLAVTVSSLLPYLTQ